MSGAITGRSWWRNFLEESTFLRQYLWIYRKKISLGLAALLVLDVLEVIPPILLKEAVDTAVGETQRWTLEGLALTFLAVAIAQAFCRYYWRVLVARSSVLAGGELRDRFAGHLFGLSASFFGRARVGELLALTTNDTEAIRRAIGPGLIVFADAIFYFLTVPVAMLILSPRLTLLAFIPLLFVPFFVFWSERQIHRRFSKVQSAFSALASAAQENLTGIRVVKAFAAEDTQSARFRALGTQFMKFNLSLERIQTALGPTMNLAISFGMVLLLYYGGGAVVTGAVTIGTFVAFQRYIQKMLWPMAALGFAVTFYQRAVASSDRMKAVLKLETDVPEGALVRAPGLIQGRVEAKKLTFQYPGSGRIALSDLSFVVEPGERVALVGPVGSGKSTLLSLIPRIYAVAPGMLYIDGVDVNEWPLETLRANVGFVSQEVFLFSETIEDNIALGLGEAHSFAKVAGVHDEIARLPAQYKTVLGERGVNLSGGQKQRISIARALAKRAPILVLDDALSAVDVETESSILRALRDGRGTRSEVIAAHRISTILDADKILVLQDGKIVQSGKHSTLIRARGGLYRHYYDQQRLESDVENYAVPS